MRALRTLLLAAACTAIAACDSGGDGDTLTASYFVGDWTLVAVSDATGDRTAEVNAVLDEVSLAFQSNGDFAMAVDYSDVVNGGGTPDTTFAGTYGVSSGSNLVLTLGDVGIALGVQREGSSRAALSAPAVVVNELLSGSAVTLTLAGTAVLTVAR